MTGPCAYYCEMLARTGLRNLHGGVAGGRGAVRWSTIRSGINTIASWFPNEIEPLVTYMRMVAFKATDQQVRTRLGTPLPESVALGPEDEPTTDASVARRRRLLPFCGRWGVTRALVLPWRWMCLGH